MHVTKERNRCLRVIFRLLIGATCLIFFHLPGIEAQEVKNPQRGYQIGGSYSLSEIESVSALNGNVMLNIPMASLPQGRGGNPGFALSLNYNSKLWEATSGAFIPPPGSNGEMHLLRPSDDGGWRYGIGYELKLEIRQRRGPQPCGSDDPQSYEPNYFAIYRLKMVFSDGSARDFHPVGFESADGYYDVDPNGKYSYPNVSAGSCFPVNGWRSTTGMTYYSVDGSHLRLEVAHDSDDNWTNNLWTLYFPDGRRVTFNEAGSRVQRIYDRNNNYIETQRIILPNNNPATKIVDQLGRSIVIEHSSSPWQDYVRAEGANGEQLQWTVVWRNINVRKAYDRGDGSVYGGGTLPMVEQIILPTQAGSLSYSFDYNGDRPPGTETTSTGWGEVRSLTLPSGAQAFYQYQLDGEPPLPTWDGVLHNGLKRKDLTYQRQYDGGASPVTETWNYTFTATSTELSSEIIGPDGGRLKEYFEDWQEGRAYRSERAEGLVIERIWQKNEHVAVPMAKDHYVKTEFISLRDSTGTLVKTAIKDFSYDKNGNVTQVTEYDWVPYGSIPRDSVGKPTGIPASAAAAVKRVMVNTYYNPTFDASNTTSDSPHLYFKTGSAAQKSLLKDSEVRADATPGSALSRAEYFYDNTSTTGNLTTERMWDSTKGGIIRPLSAGNSISITHQYDPFGNRTHTTDANNVTTRFVYGPINGHENLYVTETKVAVGTPVQRWTTQAYDFHTGLVTQSTDVDNNVTTRATYDAFGRPVLVEEADGIAGVEKQTATEYSDTQKRVIVRSDLNTIGDGKLITIQHYDQLGRICLSRRLEGGNPAEAADETKGIKVQTRYFTGNTANPNGYQLVSAPYRAATSGVAGGEPGMAWNRTKFDNGGRVIELETFAGATLPAPWGSNSGSSGKVTTEYDAEFVTLTDQAGKRRRSEIDALGRLIKLTEDPGGLNYETYYSYNALGNLRQVTQGSQTRTFVYDSLSRLVSATNPESGHMTYAYDPNGNLIEKIDARGVKTTMTYDALNRVRSKAYSGLTPEGTEVANRTPPLNYFYDDYSTLPSVAPTWAGTPSKGRLIGVTYGTGSEGTYYKYDAAGRIATNHQRQGTSNYATNYTYNLAGSLTYEQRGNYVNNVWREYFRNSWTYDNAGRLSGMQASLTPFLSFVPLVGDISYAPFGGVQSETYGNGLIHSIGYNNRLQPTEIRLGRPNNLESIFTIYYMYGIAHDVNDPDPEIAPIHNNGNIARVRYSVSGTIQYAQTFQYDTLNRLRYAVEHNNGSYNDGTRAWYQTFDYDRYGNRGINVVNTSDNADAANSALQLADFSEANNRITRVGFIYDAAGNLIAEPGKSYTYDGENRMVTATVGGVVTSQYVYDGNGRRVKKITGGVGTRFEYGAGGELIAERNETTGSVTKGYLYRGGELLATTTNGTTYEYATADHLGTPRAWTDDSGNLIAGGRHDYLPFGEELFTGVGVRTTDQGYAANTQADGQRKQFGSKERDIETGLDFFEARYFSSVQGRFTSVDPENYQAFNDLTDPQSWNAYSYVNNNPLRRTDPDGRGFQEKLKNWWTYGVYGTEDDVKAEEAKRRKELEAAASAAQDAALKEGFVMQVTVNGKTLDKLTRDEVFATSNNLRKGNIKIEDDTGLPTPTAGSAPQHPNSSDHRNITRGKGNVPNRETNLTRAEFEQNLSSAGWTKIARGNGKVVEYTKDGYRYVVRDSAKSTGGPTADFYKPGSKSIDLKIRLQ